MFFPFTFKGEFVGADGSVKNPPNVATKPNIRTTTIIDEPEKSRKYFYIVVTYFMLCCNDCSI